MLREDETISQIGIGKPLAEALLDAGKSYRKNFTSGIFTRERVRRTEFIDQLIDAIADWLRIVRE